MTLVDYVCKQAVCTDLQEEDRDKVIRAMLERFVAGGSLEQEAVEDVFQAVVKREQLGSTAIGNGIAVPHTRVDGLGTILVGFAQCPQGVEFNALDGQPVRQIFLVVASEDHSDQYLDVMENITRLVQNDDFRRFAAAAQDPGTVIDLIEEMSG